MTAGLFEDTGELHAARASRSCGINQIHAGSGQLGELFQIVAAINDAGVEEGRGFLPCFGGWSSTTP